MFQLCSFSSYSHCGVSFLVVHVWGYRGIVYRSTNAFKVCTRCSHMLTHLLIKDSPVSETGPPSWHNRGGYGHRSEDPHSHPWSWSRSANLLFLVFLYSTTWFHPLLFVFWASSLSTYAIYTTENVNTIGLRLNLSSDATCFFHKTQNPLAVRK